MIPSLFSPCKDGIYFIYTIITPKPEINKMLLFCLTDCNIFKSGHFSIKKKENLNSNFTIKLISNFMP
ncbi:MAG: hypothetical protein C0595_09305 [Marinilabiliales bacterium]|nr:MAG: hypothetical protein C0595_09305 [Marinilabiliales bacterium]